MHQNVDPADPRTGSRGALPAVAISGVLYVMGAFIPQVDGPPVETATADQIRTFLTEHDGALRTLAVAAALAIPLVLVFTVSLARLIRGRSPGSPLADLVIGGGVLVALWHWIVIAGTSSTLVQALDGTDLATVDDATLRSWYGLTNFTHFFADLGVPGMAVVVGATSIAALRTGLFARWLGWLGLIIAAGGIIGAVGVAVAWLPLADVWFVGLFGWFLWTLVVAVTCGLRLRRREGMTDAAPSPSLTV
jgi:hypothetical protein